MRNRNRCFRRMFGMGRRQMAMLNYIRPGIPVVGFGAGDKPGSGPSGNCICPDCGAKVAHTTGQPCNQKSCPKCGTVMTRE